MDEAKPRKGRRPSLLVQIAVALGLVGTVPLALAVWQLIAVNRDALFEQLLRTHTVSARTAADALDAFLEGRRTLGGALAGDPRLADPTSVEAQNLMRDSLAAWTESGVAGLVLAAANGEVAMRVRTRDRAEVVDRWAEPLPVEPRLAVIDGAPWAAVPMPLGFGGGLLVVVADASPAVRALAPDELGDQARLLLLDRTGESVWGAAAGAEALAPDLRDAALSGRLSGAGRFREPGGREVVAAWSSADNGGWIVVSLQPGAVAEAAAQRMARRSVLAVAAALLLVVALSIAAWRGLVRPLRALLAAQRAAAGGGPGAPASETAELHQALAELERRGREREAIDQIFLGRYQVMALVGSGGMGSVYRGWDPRLQRTVALKTIQIATADGAAEESAKKLLAEAVAVAQIAHPHVVAVHDAEEMGGAAFVAMEFVDGIGLDKYLEKRGRLDWREVVPLAFAMADGLAAAHARGLVHRDIKPGNVLLGDDGAIKIADFGLATFLHKLHDAPGKVFGTPGFLAPEALQGLPVDERSDLYAVGVVLFRSLLGRYPVRGTSFQQIVLATVRDPAPVPEELEGVPREVAELVCGLLEKDPERRLAPAGEVARRFAAIAHEHQLAWRLDFGAGPSAEASAVGGLSATMPTMRLDADLA
jgi:serine/threonine-protein kinase